YDTTSITVTPTAEDTTMVISVNGNVVASGLASEAIPLNVGSNTIQVILTTASGMSKTYTVVVTRASSPYLTSITVTYMNRTTPVPVNVPINKNQTQYEADIPNGVTSVTVTSYGEDNAVKILVNGNQNLASGQASSSISVSPNNQTRIPITTTSNFGTGGIPYTIIIK
ncbi:MAG TPA: cadherin-like beta sandwich domain-containing protein, partial [Clostridia bacterium]|nr:cadherin-like beta sandwich domain-containing protein [Clostridia bacterium]